MLLLLFQQYKIYLFKMPGILLYSLFCVREWWNCQGLESGHFSHIVSHVSKKLWKRAKRSQVNMIVMNPAKIEILQSRKNGLLKKGNPSKKIQRKGQYEHNTTTCLVSIMGPRYWWCHKLIFLLPCLRVVIVLVIFKNLFPINNKQAK